MNVQELITRIRDKDDKVRTAAWLDAGPLGAAAVPPLVELMTDADTEVVRAATRGLWRIVRHAGRPGADDERRAVAAALGRTLKGSPSTAVGREVLWMVSEIGGDESVEAVAPFLRDESLREDARMVLERIPGDASVAALKTALAAAADPFKPSIAVSLRNRGVDVPGIPDEKLVPRKK